MWRLLWFYWLTNFSALWRKQRLKIDDLKELYKNIPPALERLLKARGYLDCEDWDLLFRPKLSHIKNPMSLHQMDVAVERLFKAFQSQEAILIYGDFDLDGSSGVALLYSGLKSLGFKKLFHIQPKRLTQGYGFHAQILEEYQNKVSLVISVDVGITGREACQRAKELGMDVIITDHHLPEGPLPEALAILNPNKPACDSGLRHLCGAGVGYYLVLAVWMRLKEEGLIQPEAFDPKSILDLFIIGTITDLVPLVKENRVLVKHGLSILEKTKRIGLRALMQSLGLSGKRLSSEDISFKLAPKLNALSRMDKNLLPLDVLLCQDQVSASRMVEQVLALNKERVRLQKEAETEAIEREAHSEDDFCFVYDEHFHKGVIGLVATRLSGVYLKPSFVGSVRGDKISGSARLPQNSSLNLVDIMSACPSLSQFGGHAQAAGFVLKSDQAEKFRNDLRAYFEKKKQEGGLDPVQGLQDYDVEVTLDELNPNLLNWMKQLEPFGVGFESPKFKVTGLQATSARVLKDLHLKINLTNKKAKGTQNLDAIWFNHTLSSEDLEQVEKGEDLSLIGSLSWNEYMGQKKPQFMVNDLYFNSN